MKRWKGDAAQFSPQDSRSRAPAFPLGPQRPHGGPGRPPRPRNDDPTNLTAPHHPTNNQILSLNVSTISRSKIAHSIEITIRMPMKRQNKFTCVGMHHYKNLKVTREGDIVAKVHLQGHLIISILKFKPFLVIRICDKVLGYCSCSWSIVCFTNF